MKKPLTACSLLLLPATSQAALLAYDGFNNYNTSGGYSSGGNAIVYDPGGGGAGNVGQNPSSQGFTNAWSSADTYAGFVYIAAQNSQLTYNDGGSRVLSTAAGQLNFSRDAGNANSGTKTFSRDLDIVGANLSLNSMPDTLYISMLFRSTGNIPFSLSSSTTDGSTTRSFGMTVTDTGDVELSGAQSQGAALTNAGGNIASGQTHLLVFKIQNNFNPLLTSSAEGDQMSLFIDPSLDAESSNTADNILLTDPNQLNYYVAGNTSWYMKNLIFKADPEGGEGIILDEFRFGTTWEDVTPFTIVPEPSTVGLSALALAALAMRRKRA